MSNRKNVIYGLLNSILYPFRPGVLIYNIIILVSGLYFLLNLAKFVFLFTSQSTLPFTLVEQKEIVKLLPAVDKIINSHGLGFSFNNVLSNYPSALVIVFTVFILANILVLARNFDITVQTAIGNFDRARFNPDYYGSAWLWIKYLVFNVLMTLILIIILSIAIVASLAITGSSNIADNLQNIQHDISSISPTYIYIGFLLLWPIMLITLVDNYSIKSALWFVNWFRSLAKLGFVNYVLLLICLCVLYLILYFPSLYIYDMEYNSHGMYFDLALKMLYFYLSIHMMSSFHYIFGFFMQRNGMMEVVSSRAHSDIGNVVRDISHSTPIEAANKMIAKGKIDFASAAIKRAIATETQYYEKLKLYRFLIDMYKKLNHPKMVKDSEDKLIEEVVANYPKNFGDVAGILLDRVDRNEGRIPADFMLTLVQIAYERRRYNTALLMSKGFARKYPGHKDIVPIYLLVGKILIAQNKFDKAKSMLTGLCDNNPDHPKLPEIRHLLSSMDKEWII